jgi:hypothetical protein
MFELEFQTPQNFASYRQAELDNNRIGTFTQLAALPYFSKRFAMKRFLGMSEEELAENERLWKEESGLEGATITDAAAELRGVGVSGAGIEADAAGAEDEVAPAGMEAPAPDAGGAEGGAAPEGGGTI